jgi:hypothetical protein
MLLITLNWKAFLKMELLCLSRYQERRVIFKRVFEEDVEVNSRSLPHSSAIDGCRIKKGILLQSSINDLTPKSLIVLDAIEVSLGRRAKKQIPMIAKSLSRVKETLETISFKKNVLQENKIPFIPERHLFQS